jgi:hypothetical protein
MKTCPVTGVIYGIELPRGWYIGYKNGEFFAGVSLDADFSDSAKKFMQWVADGLDSVGRQCLTN